MVITVLSFKGGVGKTTTAMHLAGALAMHDTTLLVDGDPNRSATRWAARGQGGFGFTLVDAREASRHYSKYEHVVFDTEAHPSNDDIVRLGQNGKLVIPTFPDAISLDATMLMCEALQKLPLPDWQVLLTAVPPVGSAGADARITLGESGIPVLRHHIPRLAAFQKAHLAGVLVRHVRDPRAMIAWAAYRSVQKELNHAKRAA
jgi:chromosome partitioning protein